MTYLLQNDEDILNFHEFDSEQEARDFAQENIIQEYRHHVGRPLFQEYV